MIFLVFTFPLTLDEKRKKFVNEIDHSGNAPRAKTVEAGGLKVYDLVGPGSLVISNSKYGLQGQC
jgi:hypothetical protein